MPDVYMLDEQVIPAAEVGISPLCAPAMFGSGVLDRLRFFPGREGAVCPGWNRHLARSAKTAALLYPGHTDPRRNWAQMIATAVRIAGCTENTYVHLGYGPYGSSGTMLRGAGSAPQTFIFVKEEGPLYGEHGLHVSSERDFPRPDGPLHAHKTHGVYAELLLAKDLARTRLSQYAPKQGKQDARETLLFPRSQFTYEEGSGRWCLAKRDPLIAEYGCANAFAVDAEGILHLPDHSVRFFKGVTVQIVETLFRTYFRERAVCYDLRRSHLRRGGGVAGTAARELMPVLTLDGELCEVTEGFEALAGLYRTLCRGELSDKALQKEWAPVVVPNSQLYVRKAAQ